MSSDTEIYVLLGLTVIQLLERVFYYGIVWLMSVSKSSCVTSVGQGCLDAEAEMEKQTEGQISAQTKKVLGDVLKP